MNDDEAGIQPEEATDTVNPLDIDETPDFLTADDAVEVMVDDDNVPMDEDEDDDQVEDDTDMKLEASETIIPAKDMSCCQIRTHTGPVYSVASVYDAATNTLSVLSGGGDDLAYLHRVKLTSNSTNDGPTATITSQKLEHAHTDSVSCVAWNLPFVNHNNASSSSTALFEHRYAAVGAYDGAICIYNADTGAKVMQLDGPTDVEWLSWHPLGGQVLLAGSATDGTVWMYHVPREQCLQVFVGHDSGAVVAAGDFPPNGKTAVSASADGSVRIWAPRTGQTKAVLRASQQEQDAAGLTCMAVGGGPEGQLVMVGAENGQAHICHVASKKIVASLLHHDIVGGVLPQQPVQPTSATDENSMGDEQEELVDLSVEAVGFAPTAVNSNWCATGGVDGVLKIWDMTTHQCRHVCSLAQQARADQPGDGSKKAAGNHGITKLQWHPTQPLVFCSSCDGNVYVWDARNGQCLYTATGHTNVITAMDIQFVQDNTVALVTTGSEDETVRVFRVNVPALLQQNAATTATAAVYME